MYFLRTKRKGSKQFIQICHTDVLFFSVQYSLKYNKVLHIWY